MLQDADGHVVTLGRPASQRRRRVSVRVADGRIHATTTRTERLEESTDELSDESRPTSRPARSWSRWSAGSRPGGTTLEESLALWERGELLATICQEWLDGARERLDEVIERRAATSRDRLGREPARQVLELLGRAEP